MGGAAEDLDLEMQTAVVSADHGVGEARADRQVRLRQSPLKDVTRTDFAARLLVVSDVQLGRSV